jgi:KaiC/GvpD/RAD55 family RecA-like ATPase
LNSEQVQLSLISSLIADLQAHENGTAVLEPFIKVVSESVGLSSSAFTLPGLQEFYTAYRYCYMRSAPDGGVVRHDEILAEMERAGASKELIDKWATNLTTPRKTKHITVVRDLADTLNKLDTGNATIGLLECWLDSAKKDPSLVPGELLGWSNQLLGMASGGGEEVIASQIVAEADALGYVQPLSTGFADIDAALSGGGMSTGGIHCHEGDIWVIGAPSGHGKSTMACNLVANTIQQGYAAMYVTWEMSKLEIIRRMVCNIGDIDYTVATNPNAATLPQELDARKNAIELISNNVRLYEKPSSPNEIAECIKRHRVEFGDKLKWVAIDHIGIAKEASGEQSWRSMEQLVYALKGIAKQEKVGIIMFSQVPDMIEKQLRADNKATDADFRGSRGIRMGVDVAWFMCRHNGKDEFGTPNMAYENMACMQLVKDRRFGQEAWITLNYDWHRYRYSKGQTFQKVSLNAP